MGSGPRWVRNGTALNNVFFRQQETAKLVLSHKRSKAAFLQCLSRREVVLRCIWLAFGIPGQVKSGHSWINGLWWPQHQVKKCQTWGARKSNLKIVYVGLRLIKSTGQNHPGDKIRL